MRAASLTSGGNRLDQTMRILKAKWLDARESWRDEVANDFESEFIAPMERQVKSTARAIEKLGDLCAKIERDCH